MDLNIEEIKHDWVLKAEWVHSDTEQEVKDYFVTKWLDASTNIYELFTFINNGIRYVYYNMNEIDILSHTHLPKAYVWKQD